MHHAKAAAAFLAWLTLAGCQQAQGPAPAVSAGNATTAVPAPPPATGNAGAIQGATRRLQGQGLSRMVALDSIGATKEFLERTLGQSTYETPGEARYTVGNCDVALTIGTDKAVTAVSIDLSKGCRFDVSGLTGSAQPVSIEGPITFAQFESRFGNAHFSSPCLSRCGNAFDPYVDAVVSGSRANGVIDIAGHAVFVEEAVINASNVWQEALTAKLGEGYAAETRFNCEGAHDDIARAAFSQIPVQSLRFGHDLGSSECG